MPRLGKHAQPKGKIPTVEQAETIGDEMAALFTAETDSVVFSGTIRLESALEVRTEMARVYKALRAGRIPIHAGTRMVFALVQLHKAKIEADKLRVAGRLADQMQAFGGLTIVGPGQPQVQALVDDLTGKKPA